MGILNKRLLKPQRVLFFILFTLCNILGYSNESKKYIATLVLVLFAMELPNMIKKGFKWHYSMTILVVFTFFCFVSSFWAYDFDIAVNRTLSLTLLDLLYFTLWNNCISEKDSFDFLVLTIAFSGLLMSLYVIHFYGITRYFSMLTRGARIGFDITNVNYIGVNSMMSVVCFFYLFLKKHKYSYLLLIPIPFIVALGTGSKKVILLLGISLVLFIVFDKKRNFKELLKKYIRYLIIIIIVFYVLSLPMFSKVNERFSQFTNYIKGDSVVDNSTNARINLISMGIDVWKEHPFIGIGSGNSEYLIGTYFHNNYVELLATVGIIGFLLYYSLYLIPLFIIIKSRLKSKESLFGLILIISNLVLDMAAVSYYIFQNYVYFLLIFICIKKISDEKKGIIENKG